MTIVAKIREDYLTYLIIAVWIIAFTQIRSVPWLISIGIILFLLSASASLNYYKTIKSAAAREDFIRKKLLLFGLTVLSSSILCYNFILN